MDNDNILLQKARNIYKNARFGLKYRGVPICTAQEGNDIARSAILASKPMLFARCGATELRTMAEYLANGGKNYTEKIRGEVRNLSGVFPTDDATLTRFVEVYRDCAQQADLLALWDVGCERQLIRGCSHTTFTQLRALEPYYHQNPWSTALAGKKVLVVHPFKQTIESQYARRERLFPGTDILPAFDRLTVVQAVQGLAGQDTGFASWFDALDFMQKQMDAADYEVAIIGAGAYGLPLAFHARQTGHVAIQMSGATQLLFGIKGKRWDDHPIIGKLYNDAWVRPLAADDLKHKEKVEGGSYW